jgi:phosphatidylserine/phosphatidylglycerophosphate/cardiolipin synthase-like enzyme
LAALVRTRGPSYGPQRVLERPRCLKCDARWPKIDMVAPPREPWRVSDMRRSPLLAAARIAVALSTASPATAQPPAWQVCFTPGRDCTGLVVDEIAGARRSILVQAYSFTSVPILAVLKAAHARGVDVEVIVDKTSARVSKSGSRYSAATYLSKAGIPVWIDTRVAIAHNKVMVLDGATVITGSFNFTAAAQSHNAENLLVIQDAALAARYGENWERRRAVSTSYIGPVEPNGHAARPGCAMRVLWSFRGLAGNRRNPPKTGQGRSKAGGLRNAAATQA